MKFKKVHVWITLINFFIIFSILLQLQISTPKYKNEYSNDTKVTEYVASLAALRHPVFSRSVNVSSPDFTYINIALVLVHKTKERQKVQHFLLNMKKTLNSLLTHSSGIPLHFVIITSKSSIKLFGHFFARNIAKKVSETVIESVHWKWKRFHGFPMLKISFVDIKEVINTNKPFFKALKQNGVGGSSTKYGADLFYISPLLHLAFPSLDKLIMIDSSDIEFFSDIKLLQDEFKKMASELIGIGLDLSPHYRAMLEQSGYIAAHPSTELGLPGRFQGLNMGVVLFNLDRMRSSKVYNSHLNSKMVSVLNKSYKYEMTLAHQDWFTNLQWSQPSLFYILPCKFNTQTSVQYFRPPWEPVFSEYHHCGARSSTLIIHRNGCGPNPSACGYNIQPDNKFWTQHTLDLDVPMFFQAMAAINNKQG